VGGVSLHIILFDKTFEVENKEEAVKEFFAEINTSLEEQNLYFSHLTIDGIDVYEDHFNYVLNRLTEVRNIVVVSKPYKEIVNDMLLSANEYLLRVIPKMNDLLDGFYTKTTKEQWIQFEQLLEGIQWLLQMISMVVERKVDYQNRNRYEQIQQQLVKELANLEQAMEDGDTTLIGDILQYEITPFLEQLSIEVTSTIEDEGLDHDIH
jgi:hypothetical protein